VNRKLIAMISVGLFAEVLGPSCARESSVKSTIAYVDSAQGFSFEVPSSWHVNRTEYEIVHYTDVILSVNSESPDFRFPDAWTLAREVGGGVAYPTDWGKLLNPGMVCVVFTYAGGPGFWPPCYGNAYWDSFDDALAKALKPAASKTATDVEIYSLHFAKWSRHWQIVAWMRKPLNRHTRDQAVALLKSIRFRETPIVSSDQAVGAAIEHLPTLERQAPWPAASASNCAYQTTVTDSAGGYFIKFVRYSEEDPKQIQGRWDFVVRQDGSVEEIR
jgi:hypothetical protein